MVQTISTGTFGVAKWVVSPDATQGTHTTITAALTSASSGDTIWVRDGTYTENITMKTGVSVTAAPSSGNGANCIIAGSVTYTSAGITAMSGMTISPTASSAIICSGASAGSFYIDTCTVNGNSATAINITNSNAAFLIEFQDCFISTISANAFLNSSSPSQKIFFNTCTIADASGSYVAATVSDGICHFLNSDIDCPIVTSGTGTIGALYSRFGESGANQTWVTFGGSLGNGGLNNCVLSSGTAVCATVNMGTTTGFTSSLFITSNVFAISGTGTLNYSLLSFAVSAAIQPTLLPWTVRLGTFSTDVSSRTSVNFAASPYTVLPSDTFISVNSTGGPVTLLFPNVPLVGQEWTVKDAAGTSAANNITLTTPGGATLFDGAATFVMNTNYQSNSLIGTSTPSYEMY